MSVRSHVLVAGPWLDPCHQQSRRGSLGAGCRATDKIDRASFYFCVTGGELGRGREEENRSTLDRLRLEKLQKFKGNTPGRGQGPGSGARKAVATGAWTRSHDAHFVLEGSALTNPTSRKPFECMSPILGAHVGGGATLGQHELK